MHGIIFFSQSLLSNTNTLRVNYDIPIKTAQFASLFNRFYSKTSNDGWKSRKAAFICADRT